MGAKGFLLTNISLGRLMCQSPCERGAVRVARLDRTLCQTSVFGAIQLDVFQLGDSLVGACWFLSPIGAG